MENATKYIDVEGTTKLVLITKDLPTLEQLQNGTFTFWLCQELTNGTKEENTYSGVTASAMDENNVLWRFVFNSSTRKNSSSSSDVFGIVCLEDNFTFYDITIPEKGVYVMYRDISGGEK